MTLNEPEQVYAAGLHYPCNKPHPETAAVDWKLWSSEDYSRDPAWADGGTYWGKALSQNYVLMNATATISWSLIWSAYDNLVCDGAGLMRAHTPWNGWYEASAPIWLSAHTTQFTTPGWRYLSVSSTGSGLILGATGAPAGTWVSLVPPAGAPAALTVVVETMDNDSCLARKYEPVVARFVVEGGGALPAPGATLHVWRSSRDALFVQEADIALAADGSFTLSLLPGEMVTASTVSGATHGSFDTPIPADLDWQLPFADNFSSYADGSLPRFFSDQGGAWTTQDGEIVQRGWGDPGSNGWGSDVDPLTQVVRADRVGNTVRAILSPTSLNHALKPTEKGSVTWGDYTVTATARFNSTGPYGSMGPAGPLSLRPCDYTDLTQSFLPGPAAGYLQNAVSKGCIDINACETVIDTYECVTSGGSCGNAGEIVNLEWKYNAATGELISAFNSLRLTALANGTLLALPATGDATQAWAMNASSGQIALRSGGGCVAGPPRRTYARVCGRVQSFSGFAGDLTAYCLEVLHSGDWALVAHAGQAATPLASGTLDAFDAAQRNALSLTFAGPLVSASARGDQLAQVDVGFAVPTGNVLLGGGWHALAFSDVRVNPA